MKKHFLLNTNTVLVFDIVNVEKAIENNAV
ncbi:hypothetical protein [Eubacterium limosum]